MSRLVTLRRLVRRTVDVHGGHVTDRLLYPVPEAAVRLGIGRSKIYELISTGSLESVKLGKSRLIPAEAIERFVADLRLTAAVDPQAR